MSKIEEIKTYVAGHRLITDFEICNDHVWLLQKHSGNSFITCGKVEDFDNKFKGMEYEWHGFSHRDCPIRILNKAPVIHDKEWRHTVRSMQPSPQVVRRKRPTVTPKRTRPMKKD